MKNYATMLESKPVHFSETPLSLQAGNVIQCVVYMLQTGMGGPGRVICFYFF